jgi:hypothetical protein
MKNVNKYIRVREASVIVVSARLIISISSKTQRMNIKAWCFSLRLGERRASERDNQACFQEPTRLGPSYLYLLLPLRDYEVMTFCPRLYASRSGGSKFYAS